MSTEWMRKALCQHFPALPWVAEPTARTPATLRAMEVVCQACPVHHTCEEYAERHEVSSGFWAGRDWTPPELLDREDGVA